MKRRNDEIKKAKAVWTAEEDDSLLKAVKKERADRAAERDAEDEEDWDEIAKSVLGKTPVQCLKRYMTLNSKLKASTPIEPPAEQDSKPPAREPKETAATKRDPEEATEKEEDEDDDGDDETGEPSSKQARTEGGETGPSWPQEETDLLKKLVEQYKESKLFSSDQIVHTCLQSLSSYLLPFSYEQVLHDGMRSQPIFPTETPLIVSRNGKV